MGVLDGVRVIDLSRVLAGPFCSQWLGDHGAKIIKVEPPQGDETRTWGPPFNEGGVASYFQGVNRNKRAISLDLRQDAGRAVLLRLLDGADVLLENFKTGTMEKWGLSPEMLAERFPRLVYCRISGFGADGPLGGLPGYDAVVQAQSGLMSVNGDPESGATRLGIPIVDLGTALSSAFAVAGALYERERSGRGQFVDMTLYDCGLSLFFPYGANYFMSGKRPGPLGNRHPNMTPYEKFATQSVDVFIGVGNDRQFARLAEHLGRADCADDPRYRTMGARNENREALIAELAPLVRSQEGQALAEALMRLGVPAGAVQGAPEVAAHPHTQHRGMIVEDPTAPGGPYTGIANPVKYSRTPPAPSVSPPAFGQDTRSVLAEAGYSAEEIDALIAEGAARTEPL